VKVAQKIKAQVLPAKMECSENAAIKPDRLKQIKYRFPAVANAAVLPVKMECSENAAIKAAG